MFERSRTYYLYNKPIDIRKSFNGLSGIVQDKMCRQVVDGSGYIFLNKRRSHLKLLIWEGDGFSIYYKRLERGTFEHPNQGIDGKISYDKLLLILQGLEEKKITKRRRFKGLKV
jgi:transposase